MKLRFLWKDLVTCIAGYRSRVVDISRLTAFQLNLFALLFHYIFGCNQNAIILILATDSGVDMQSPDQITNRITDRIMERITDRITDRTTNRNTKRIKDRITDRIKEKKITIENLKN